MAKCLLPLPILQERVHLHTRPLLLSTFGSATESVQFSAANKCVVLGSVVMLFLIYRESVLLQQVNIWNISFELWLPQYLNILTVGKRFKDVRDHHRYIHKLGSCTNCVTSLVGLIAELVTHYNSMAAVMGLNPVQTWILFRLYFCNCLICACNCNDLSCL